MLRLGTAAGAARRTLSHALRAPAEPHPHPRARERPRAPDRRLRPGALRRIRTSRCQPTSSSAWIASRARLAPRSRKHRGLSWAGEACAARSRRHRCASAAPPPRPKSATAAARAWAAADGPSNGGESNSRRPGAGPPPAPRGPLAGRQVRCSAWRCACAPGSRDASPAPRRCARAMAFANAASVNSPLASTRACVNSVRTRRRSSASIEAGYRGVGRLDRGESSIRCHRTQQAIRARPLVG